MLPALRNPSTSAVATHPTNRISDLVDDFFRTTDWFFNREWPAPAWQAPSNLGAWEDEENVYVESDLPGVAAADVDVAVHQGVLTIRGERKGGRSEPGFDGRAYGQFTQRVTLPAEVDADKVEATLANGVLRLTLPKCEASKPRKISVRGG